MPTFTVDRECQHLGGVTVEPRIPASVNRPLRHMSHSPAAQLGRDRVGPANYWSHQDRRARSRFRLAPPTPQGLVTQDQPVST